MERFIRAARVLGIYVPKPLGRIVSVTSAYAIFIALVLLPAGPALAGGFTAAKVALADPRPSATSVNYTFSASSVTSGGPGAVKCIKLVFSTTSTGTTVPTDFDSSVAAVALDVSGTNYVPTPGDLSLDKTTNGTLLLTDAAGQTPASSSGRTISVNGITNSSVADTGYYLRVNTFNNTDCLSNPVDSGTVQFINSNGSILSLTVDPSLTFTVNGMNQGDSCDGATTTGASSATSIPFGSVTLAANGLVCQDLQAATNAAHGYSLYMRYSGAPQSGTNFIDDHSGSNDTPTGFSAPGVEAYGYSTDDSTLGTGTPDRFTNPSQKWAALTTSNAEIGYENTPAGTNHYHIAHQVGVAPTTRAGSYTTTIIYTCTPVY